MKEELLRQAVGQAPLTEKDKAVLTFAAQWWKHQGAKVTAIRDTLGMSETRYYQHLNWLLDQQSAYQHDPMLIKRLLRLRDQGRSRRH